MKNSANRTILLGVLCVCAIGFAFAGGPTPVPPSGGSGAVTRPISPLLDVSEGGTNAGTATGARANLDIYSKGETDDIAAGASLLYYFKEQDGSFAGYELLDLVAPVALASDTAKPVTSTTVPALIDQWVTATGSPDITTLRASVYTLHQYVTKGGGSDVRHYYELGIVSNTGVWTLVASSVEQLLTLDNTLAEISTTITVTTPVTMLNTDYLAIREYALVTGSVSSVQVWYGGNRQGFFSVPINSGNYARTDLSNITASGVAVIQSYAGGGGGSYDIATLTRVATNTAATRLTTDGNADGVGNRLTLASGSAVTGVAIFSAEMNDATKSTFGCVVRFAVKRVGSTVTVVNNSIENILDPVSVILATSAFRLVNDDANGTYYPEFTAGNAVSNVSTKCRIDFTNVTNP